MKMKSLFFVAIFISFVPFLGILGCGESGGSKNPVSTTSSPRISAISPSTGIPGTSVTIQGQGFGSVQGQSLINYAGVSLKPDWWSDSAIIVTIPLNSSVNGSFVITVNGATSNPSNQFVLSEPILSSLSPSSGTSGTQVTLSGKYFGATQGSSYVAFNSQIAQIVNWNTNVITCTLPASGNLSPGNISVIVWVDGNRPSNPLVFTLISAAISAITPQTDNIGATITISGNGFGLSQNQVNGAVRFGGIIGVPSYWSDSSIQVKVPHVQIEGIVNVIIISNQIQSAPFPFTVSRPDLTSLSPNSISRGEVLTINGAYFGLNQSEGQGTVTIDGFAAITQSWQDNRIQVIVPNGASTGDNKTVRVNVGGLEGSRSDLKITLF